MQGLRILFLSLSNCTWWKITSSPDKIGQSTFCVQFLHADMKIYETLMQALFLPFPFLTPPHRRASLQAEIYCNSITKITKLLLCHLESKCSCLCCLDHLLIQHLTGSFTASQVNQIDFTGCCHLCLRVLKNLCLEVKKQKKTGHCFASGHYGESVNQTASFTTIPPMVAVWTVQVFNGYLSLRHDHCENWVWSTALVIHACRSCGPDAIPNS